MKIWEAMKVMREGKKVRQTDWHNEDRYICLQNGDHGHIVDNHGDPYILTFIDDREWEIYDRKFIRR